jgi:MYXO-CTERM domain-containing protein
MCYGARVASDGTVLDPGPISLTLGSPGGISAAAVAGGNDYGLFAWIDMFGLQYSIVGAATGIVAPRAVTVADPPASGTFGGIAAASDGTTFAVLYSSPSGLYAAIIDPTSSAAPSPVQLAMSGAFSAVALAYGPSGYVAEAVSPAGLTGFGFDASATHIVTLSTLGSIATPPALVFDGASLVLAWNGGSSVYATTLDSSGAMSSPVTVFAQATSAGAPALAGAGDGYSMAAATLSESVGQAAAAVSLFDSTSLADAGLEAGPPEDAGPPDAADAQAQEDSSSPQDASPPDDDSSAPDAGIPDGAGPVDDASTDSGPIDASSDAGSDAEVADASAMDATGSSHGSAPSDTSGCGCRAAGAPEGNGWAVVLVGVAVSAARRRRRR